MQGSRERELAPELGAAIAACRSGLTGTALVSGLINLLMLTGPLFMLQIYDRVLPSRSVPTLFGLSLLALVMFLFYGALEILRGRVLVRISGTEPLIRVMVEAPSEQETDEVCGRLAEAVERALS